MPPQAPPLNPPLIHKDMNYCIDYSNICTAEANQGNKLYETMKLKLTIYQSQTKKRVASYIIVFIVTGVFSKRVNFID